MTLAILAFFGVLSILLFALRGFLDQLPDVFASAGRARDAWHALKQARSEEAQREALQSAPPSDHQDEQPPAAA
ncbi:hypothetical protein OIE73_07060 [Streptomyces hirsutus]|uniref:Secreted protein n=1 Tax=Streptomyces hirsutus TaxID=35620 RepID=A0ABZ1GLG5_9ACTN|nr:hypothetical protein [Streptomyces hirsutus]WSD05543.1 hypothetical protein OIE73_07060 [Streptomyces hirsutus]